MMSLLTLDRVGKRYRDGQRERIALDDVSLTIEPGELLVVYGQRRSGRTTLLRVAACIERPDTGSVLLHGASLSEHPEDALGDQIGYVQKAVRGSEEQGVLEQVAAPLLARGAGVGEARALAREALARADAERCAADVVGELSAAELLRVALARTLTLSPAVVIFDEPTATAGLSERDSILSLLGRLAHEGTAILSSTSEPDELAGADRGLTLTDGVLRGPASPATASVIALRRRAI
jgi:putative ABC transport system ATP-binding protein